MYEGDSTCSDKMASQMAHPFFLAKLARAATGSGRRKAGSSRNGAWMLKAGSRRSICADSGLYDAAGRRLLRPLAIYRTFTGSGARASAASNATKGTKYTYDINGQTVTIDQTMIGTSLSDDGSGLIDITHSNAKDLYTGDASHVGEVASHPPERAR